MKLLLLGAIISIVYPPSIVEIEQNPTYSSELTSRLPCPVTNATHLFYMLRFVTEMNTDIAATRTSLEIPKYSKDGLPKVYTEGMDPIYIITQFLQKQGVEIVNDSEICASISVSIAEIQELNNTADMHLLYMKVDNEYLALYRDRPIPEAPLIAVKLDSLFNVQKIIDNR